MLSLWKVLRDGLLWCWYYLLWGKGMRQWEHMLEQLPVRLLASIQVDIQHRKTNRGYSGAVQMFVEVGVLTEHLTSAAERQPATALRPV